jgi:hypothetical protein
MDCWRQCIAHVMGMDSKHVPDFVAQFGSGWVEGTNSWLNVHGAALVGMIAVDARRCVDIGFIKSCPVQMILVGPCGSQHHAVVKEADGTFYDPMPRGRGLAAVRGAYFVVRT